MRAALKTLALLTTILALGFGGVIWSVVRVPRPPQTPAQIINDVTQLNPVKVDEVLVPKTTEEIVRAIQQHAGPISIGGARHRMGGQLAAPGGLHLDLRQFDSILDFAPEEKTITVQAGARWRQIEERIDSKNLSLLVMQSYAGFTVGGSLSVNAHGRGIAAGPLISSVHSFRIVLADGSAINASRSKHADVFAAAIGGYGGIGVITDATLTLAENVKLKRTTATMPVSQYRQYFQNNVHHRPDALFHNADLYPNALEIVRAITFLKTDEPVTIPDRLIPAEVISVRTFRLLLR